MDKAEGVVDILRKSEEHIPLFLYHYYSFDDYTQGIFEKNEVFFSSPASFNDPFDSKISFIYEGSRTDRKRFIKDWSERHRPNLSRKERLDFEKRIRKQEMDRQKIPDGVHEKFMTVRRSMGVYCMTEDKENILMWSHYAKEHTGFCVELRTDNAIFSRAHPVIYDKFLPSLNLLEPIWDKLIKKVAGGILVKAPDWAYEKEWRIIDIDGVGTHEYPSEALSGVILGCRTLPENKKLIKAWCSTRESTPTVYEAREKSQEFGLDIISLS